ncbi:hypothetical protein Avbf_08271 [Armadillidium vulgare]|nr:hypothetical protein Avbf_08271 [Armadillidium vulgare]
MKIVAIILIFIRNIFQMASRFLRTSYIVAKCSFCQKVSKTTVQEVIENDSGVKEKITSSNVLKMAF